MQGVDRRQFLKIAGIGGVVFASRLARGADPYASAQDEFFFVQLSDTHIGFQGPPNPDPLGTLPKAIGGERARPAARHHRLHRRPVPHDR